MQALNKKQDWIQSARQVLGVGVKYEHSLRDVSVAFLHPPVSIFKDTVIKGNLKFCVFIYF